MNCTMLRSSGTYLEGGGDDVGRRQAEDKTENTADNDL